MRCRRLSLTGRCALEDTQYYDKHCKAYAELKERVRLLGLSGGPRVIIVVDFEADSVTF